MNQKERMELNRDIEAAYKEIMRPLYLKWRQYANGEVNEMFSYWIARHHHEKIMDLYNRRKHRKLRYKAVKEELDRVKTKDELNNFLEEK